MKTKRKILMSVLILVIIGFITFYMIYDNNTQRDDEIKVAYICKDLSNSWFEDVVRGIKNSSLEHDVNYIVYNADFDDAKCLEYVDAAIEWGADGILICTTNQKLGPAIAKKCSEAEVMLVTIDDTMTDDNGFQLPHIGMATTELCTMGGSALSKMAKERDFFAEGNIVKVLQIDVSILSVFQERLSGYNEAIITQTPIVLDDIITIDSPTGMLYDNIEVLKASDIDWHSATHWIITGSNDDCALACLYVLREAGIPEDNIIACGLGLSSRENVLNEFVSGNENYISIAAQPEVEGEKGVEMVYEYVNKGVSPNSMTVIGGQIITMNNYKMLIEDYSN